MTTQHCRSTGKGSISLALSASLMLLCAASAQSQNAVIITNLVSFNGANGQQPAGTLLQASDGNFYGTTLYGGSNANGTVYRVNAAAAFTNLAIFSGSNGANPNAGVIEGSDGNLYGTTTYGGTFTSLDPNHVGFGTVFKLTLAGGLSSVASFNGVTGKNPNALNEVSPGVFYGTANSGGAFSNFAGFGYGTVFRADTSGAITDLFSFDDTNGGTPSLGLTAASGGALYGTTASGGSDEYGIVYRLGAGGSSIAAQFDFTFTNGAVPTALITGRDGNLYGAAVFGGTNRYGTLFKLNTNLTQLTTLVTFDGTNGGSPTALIQGSDGNFYGLTAAGGAHGYGNVFELTTNGVFIPLYQFTGGADGYGGTTLIQGKDGNFYGTTEFGGTASLGNVFKLTVFPAPLIQDVIQTNHTITFSWKATAGMTYDVQYCADLAHPAWSKLNSVTPSGTLGTMTDAIAAGSQRFYRVALNVTKPGAPLIQNITQGNHSVTLSWTATVGANYQVQYTSAPMLNSWTNLQSVMASNSLVSFTDNTIGNTSRRFYRVALTGQ